MFNGVHEKSLHGKTENKVKIRYYSGAKIEDLRSLIESIITEKKPKILILNVGTIIHLPWL